MALSRFNSSYLSEKDLSHTKRKAKMQLIRLLLNLDLLGLNNDDIVNIVVATMRELYGKKFKATDK